MTDLFEQTVPADFVEVGRAEFFDMMNLDRRDIMPSHHDREFTSWEVVASRSMWGWSVPGWNSAHGTRRRYAIKGDQLQRLRERARAQTAKAPA